MAPKVLFALTLVALISPVSSFILRHRFYDFQTEVSKDVIATVVPSSRSLLKLDEIPDESMLAGLIGGTLLAVSDGLSVVYDLCASILDSSLRFVGVRRQRTGIHGWIVEREEGQAAFFNVHIPKTAGSSFTLDVASGSVLPPGVGFLSEEWCFHSAWDANLMVDKFITFLRNPTDHVYSMFFECAYTKWGLNNFDAPENQKTNFSAWIRHFRDDSTKNNSVDAYGCYDPRNMQTRAFTCRGKEDALHHQGPHGVMHMDLTSPGTKKMASNEVALQRMEESFFFVGIVEQYHLSWCMFYAKVNSKMPAGCDCRDKRAWGKSGNSLRHLDFAVPKHNAKADLSADDLSVIADLTTEDQKLYDTALQRFEKQAKEAEVTYDTKLMC